MDPAPVFYRHAPVASGTKNLAKGPAMTEAEFDAAWATGAEEARKAVAEGCKLVAAGEMGIGNTTPAACLAALLADVPVDDAVGPGAGADAPTLVRKRKVVATAVAHARPLLLDKPKAAIAEVAGFEIVAMAGFYAEAAKAGVTVVLDGYVSGAAALVAARLAPLSVVSMIAGHRSAEPGHKGVIAALGLEPVLDWNMRLGEGTGALLAMPVLDSAAAILTQMATLEELGVGRKD